MPPMPDRDGQESSRNLLLSPGGIAAAVAIILATMLIAYLLAFGGFSTIARFLGFGGPNLGPSAAGTSTPSLLQQCSQELSELKMATLGTFQALGELPSAKAIFEAEGIPTTDPWGHPYRYHRTPDGRQFWFSSDGPDGVPDNTDDLETLKAP